MHLVIKIKYCFVFLPLLGIYLVFFGNVYEKFYGENKSLIYVNYLFIAFFYNMI